MAKDTKKTQKVSVKKEEIKKQPKKEIKSNKKVVIEEVVDTNKDTVKIVKNEKKKETKRKKESFSSVIKAVDDKRWIILAGVVGFLVATLLFRCILWPDRIATLKDGTQPIASFTGETITADDLYENMKEHYSVNVLLNEIDNIILTEKYPENDEMNTEVNETAEYYYNVYGQSGYSKEDFLSNYGFASEKDFVESLKLDYRRNKYFENYAESLVTEKEIEKYYKDEVFGDVDSKHILVKIDNDSEDGLSDKDAEKLAKEIISKLNEGKTWDEVVKEYKDKIVHEELGYQAFNAGLEASYLKECKNLEVGKYSKTPVLTSYGYHIVYKIQQKDKPSLEDVKDDVIDVLATEIKNSDTNLYYKALIVMREDAKLEFTDTKLGDEYKKHTSTYK